MENIALRYELFADLIKEFALNEVKPLAKEVDEEEKFPAETVKKMAECGLMGINVPTEFGGAGGDQQHRCGSGGSAYPLAAPQC